MLRAYFTKLIKVAYLNQQGELDIFLLTEMKTDRADCTVTWLPIEELAILCAMSEDDILNQAGPENYAAVFRITPADARLCVRASLFTSQSLYLLSWKL